MGNQPCITATDVRSILDDISNSLWPDAGLNERYVHHMFSHALQSQFDCLLIDAAHNTIRLHPEWPTCKKSTSVKFAKYRKTKFERGPDAYMPIEVDERPRGAGFIDFAIGDYHAPDIAVEFSLKFGWEHEEVIYDFMKLIDPRNPFRHCFSHNIIIREALATIGLDNLEAHIQDALEEAIHRLDGEWCGADRSLEFIVSEIAPDARRHWHYHSDTRRFVRGLHGDLLVAAADNLTITT